MVERRLEVHSSLSSSAAMDSPHACTTPARSGTLIALYDVGIHVAVLAHGALPALLAVAVG